jgi:hypothetical protein
MEKKIELVIKKILFKKYPYLTDVNVEDAHLYGKKSHMGYVYECYFKTDRCLTEQECMEIDTEVKTFYKMISPISNRYDEIKRIYCFFDCGDGNGYQFKSTLEYRVNNM